MTLATHDDTLVRGADGRLYAVSKGVCKMLSEEMRSDAVGSPEEETRNVDSTLDHASSRLEIVPGDHTSSRLEIVPGDHASSRLEIVPGDHASSRLEIVPGDYVAA